MSLCEITEENDHGAGNYLRQHRINPEIFYQYLQQDIIQRQVEKTDHEVPK
jgi:hypothetical protein